MTAMQELIEKIKEQQNSYITLGSKNKQLKTGVDAVITATTLIVMEASKLLVKEKQQIVDACYHGSQNLPYEIKDKSKQYFKENYE